mmetsp:Transcript_87060/g.174171  ORF Transcript_87060/g.174171 Transcript_87060/m.174171 type:complete len:572 (-) Transcript_87060:135-1850(-)
MSEQSSKQAQLSFAPQKKKKRGRAQDVTAVRGVPDTAQEKQQQQQQEQEHSLAGQPRYKFWPGRNDFFCGGRMMVGVHWRQCLLSLGMLWGTVSLFLALVAPALETLHPQPSSPTAWPFSFLSVPNSCWAFSTASTVLLLVTACTDPGIVPRGVPSPLVDLMPPQIKTQIRYCSTCHVVRPSRAKHCRYCDNCVRTFDHHCPWTGNCIGERNYRPFLLFLAFTAASACCVLVGSARVLSALCSAHSSRQQQQQQPLSDSTPATSSSTQELPSPSSSSSSASAPPAPPLGGDGGSFGVWSEGKQVSFAVVGTTSLLCLWTLAASAYLGSLLVFHAYLLALGKTTNEYLKPNSSSSSSLASLRAGSYDSIERGHSATNSAVTTAQLAAVERVAAFFRHANTLCCSETPPSALPDAMHRPPTTEESDAEQAVLSLSTNQALAALRAALETPDSSLERPRSSTRSNSPSRQQAAVEEGGGRGKSVRGGPAASPNVNLSPSYYQAGMGGPGTLCFPPQPNPLQPHEYAATELGGGGGPGTKATAGHRQEQERAFIFPGGGLQQESDSPRALGCVIG